MHRPPGEERGEEWGREAVLDGGSQGAGTRKSPARDNEEEGLAGLSAMLPGALISGLPARKEPETLWLHLGQNVTPDLPFP